MKVADARKIIEAAKKQAETMDKAVSIIVVNAAGVPILLEKNGEPPAFTSVVAEGKAAGSAFTGRDSAMLAQMQERVPAMIAAMIARQGGRFLALQGAVPLMQDGEVVGAVGVSGASSADEDRELALAGVAAAESAAAASANGGSGNGGSASAASASYFPRDVVAAKFASGGLLLEKPRYKIDAGRRTGPGDVEVHAHEVDVMHVLQGTATVIAGEDTHELGEGDVLEIPAGVPHQFTDASDPFLYFVVKVAS